jgi:phosphocarrier protein
VTSREVVIRNRLGMHARAAARFVHTASQFRSRVTVRRQDRVMDGKSILGILLLAAAQGTQLELRAEGDDEKAAIDALSSLVASGFGEDA